MRRPTPLALPLTLAGLAIALAAAACLLLYHAPDIGLADVFGPSDPVAAVAAKSKSGVVMLKALKSNDWGTRATLGSGVVVDDRGYVVTNHHVIEGAKSVSGSVAGGAALELTVVAEIAAGDLAVLKLSGGTYSALALSESAPAPGEAVVSIGNPFGFPDSVSSGVVSALAREIAMPNATLRDLIQHTCPINPGNSGGPLLNLKGEVIGINVALRDGAQCISFAIPASAVKAALAKHLPAR